MILSVESKLRIEKIKERLSEKFTSAADIEPDNSKEKLKREKKNNKSNKKKYKRKNKKASKKNKSNKSKKKQEQ